MCTIPSEATNHSALDDLITIGCLYFCYLCSPQFTLVFGQRPRTVAGCLE
jgi:hypothetical protein